MRTPTRRSSRGTAILEFALGWSLLWLLFTGVYQFGMALYVYNKLQYAATNGAMLAARANYDLSNTGLFTTQIGNMVVYGNPGGGSSPVVPELSTANVNVSVGLKNSYPVTVTVSIQNYTIASFFRSFQLNNKPRVSVIYAGAVVCSAC